MDDIKKCDYCGPTFDVDTSCWGPTLEPCILKYPKNCHDWIRKPQDRKSYKFELMILSYCPECGRTGSVDTNRWFRVGKIIKNASGESIERVYNDSAKRELDPNTRTVPMFEVAHPFVSYITNGKE